MRNLDNGESLNRSELFEIVDNFYVSKHARERIYERGTTIRELKDIIKNPYVAYFNTDGSINIAKDDYNYMVITWDEMHQNYIMITYKEKSLNGISIIEKMEMAKKGIGR